jgi:hypothetical protein
MTLLLPVQKSAYLWIVLMIVGHFCRIFDNDYVDVFCRICRPLQEQSNCCDTRHYTLHELKLGNVPMLERTVLLTTASTQINDGFLVVVKLLERILDLLSCGLADDWRLRKVTEIAKCTDGNDE